MHPANNQLQSLAISHSLDLSQYSNEVVRKIISILNKSDARLFEELQTALDRLNFSTFTVERLEAMLGSVRALNSQAYAQATGVLQGELLDFVKYETAYQAQVLVSVLPVTVHVATVNAASVYASALARPFQGFLLKEFLRDIEASKAKKIRQAVAQGFVESKTTAQIVKEIRGTKAKGYADGILEITRRDAQAVVRTALGHMAGFVHDRHAEANADIIKFLRWSSTIDLRTSKICLIRDGRLYTPVTHQPVGHSLPWMGGPSRAHFSCRSAQVIVLKSYRELGIEILGSANLKGDRASMDGPLDSSVTYPDWLQKQSVERQIEVLGKKRAALLQKGGLKVEDMYSQKGMFLSLSDLKERNAKAFKKAGF